MSYQFQEYKKVFGSAVLISMIFALTGCEESSDRVKELSTQETQAQLQAEKEFLGKRSEELEADLSKRQNFYQSVAGVYEGDLIGAGVGDSYRIRIRLVPSLPLFIPNRVRMPEEVVNDLNQLYYNAQIQQWKPGSPLGAVGCRVAQIRPDLENGKITIASPDCPSFYEFQIGATNVRGMSTEERRKESSSLAKILSGGNQTEVTVLSGNSMPTSSSLILSFVAERVQ